MRFLKSVFIAGLVLSVAGCEYFTKPKTSCTDEVGQKMVYELVQSELEKQLKEYAGDDGRKKFELAKIRASVDQLKFAMQSVRTAKEDPNSSKIFCEAEFNITFPAKVLDDADVALKESEAIDKTVEDALDRFGFKKSAGSANVYSAHLLYALQPTDDGKQVYAEVENSGSLVEGIAEVLNQSLSKSVILDAKNAALREEAEAVAEEARMVQEAEAEAQKEFLQEEARQRGIETAEANRQIAVLKQAQEENKQAKSQLNRIWSSLDENVKSEIEGAQKAWVDEKTAACKKHSLSSAGTDTEIETIRVKCDTQWVQQRVREYQNAMN